MKNYKILFLWALFSTIAVRIHAAPILRGMVMERTNSGVKELPGASVFWENLSAAAISDSTGWFEIPVDSLPAKLVVSYTGYISDTVLIKDLREVHITLKPSIELKEVQVTGKQDAVSISTINTINGEKITQRELLKAACCNLSEAFETNPTVTVAYRDAVTGAKEIRMLGLAGIYSQLMTENIPNMRGLAAVYGLTYIPGPWMESIQITKGTGSVLNGFESTTGQINVEFKKPYDEKTPRLFLNLFTDNFGGNEINAFHKHKVNEQWSTILMVHGRYMNSEIDRNKDGFMDLPKNRQFNVYNRWQYDSGKKMEAQLGVKFLSDEIMGGQFINRAFPNAELYGTAVNTKRAEFFGKLGFVYPGKPFKSIGNIFQITYHDMNSNFGPRAYNADQRTLLYQGIYQNILWKSNHQYKVGFSYRYDELNQHFFPLADKITESLPGVFAEYTYNYLDKFTIVTGVREDVRNNNESIFTPRLHAKYNFNENTIVRISGGRSYRRPFVVADHLSVLATSRQLIFRETLQAEKAWNYGFNFTKRFKANGREGTISLDAYRTHFINQIIVDTYSNSSAISFYNLDGTSFSNSVQLTFNYELIKRLDVRLAYKLEDVQSTFNNKLARVPMIARDRALLNLAYANQNGHWKFDFTTVWEGPKPMQNVFTDAMPASDQSRPDQLETAPSFVTVNFQVTKEFRKFDVYAGSENLFDFRQTNPVLQAENPFASGFDATNVWGPIAGRRIYAGIRISMK